MKNPEMFHYLSIALAALAAIVVAISYPVKTTTITIGYEVMDVGRLGADGKVYGLNDLGQVVGTFETGNGKQHAFLWDRINGMQDLTPGGNFNSHAKDINNLGQVTVNVGYRWHKYPSEYRQGFLWDKTDCFPIQDARYALYINDLGQIAGKSDDGTALWNSFNDVLNIGKALGFSYTTGINNVGQIIGKCTCEKRSCIKRACLWDSKKGIPNNKDVISLGSLGGNYTMAFGINDLGRVVGESSLRVGFEGERRAFIWDSTQGMKTLSTFDNALNNKKSSASDINNAGLVVGYVNEVYGADAFLWDPKNGMRNLNDLIDPNSGWHLDSANNINENGSIVGPGFFKGEKHAFLLTPVPP